MKVQEVINKLEKARGEYLKKFGEYGEYGEWGEWGEVFFSSKKVNKIRKIKRREIFFFWGKVFFNICGVD